MCKFPQIKAWNVGRGNNKGIRGEKYHQVLNKTQAIAGQDHGIHDTFIQNAKTSQ